MLNRRQALSMGAAVAAFGLFAPASFAQVSSSQEGTRKTINDKLNGNIWPVHDPSAIRQDDTFHLFTTSQIGEAPGLIHWRTSTDLVTWSLKGAVFASMPEWAARAIPGTGGIWAPDVSFSNGQYRIYYAVSTFGSNHSAIGLVTTPTLDTTDPKFGWTDQGMVFESTINDDFNAIDPNAFTDDDGRQWLAFGSFWTGLKLIELDPATGKPKEAKPQVTSILRRPSAVDAVEAPFMIKRNGHYYLFASYDFCCRGADSTYYTVVGRSDSIAGPFIDRKGKPMNNDGGLVVLHANLDPTGRWKGPGGCSILSVGTHDFIVYHAYDAQNGGRPTLRMNLLAWTPDGWPVAV